MLRLTDFWITVILHILQNFEPWSYIMNSKVKVETNDVAISKSLKLVIRDDILNILHVRKHYFIFTRRIASYVTS